MATSTPCWYCLHVIAVDPATSIANCLKHPYNCHPEQGCMDYERVPGVDDDGWTPLRSRIAPWKPEPEPAPRSRGNDGWWTEPPRPRRPPRVIPVVLISLPQRDAFGGMFNWDDD